LSERMERPIVWSTGGDACLVTYLGDDHCLTFSILEV
jgi:hypothetical protein